MSSGVTNVSPDTAEALVLGVRRDILTLKSEVQLFMPLAPHLGWLPKVGPTVVAAPHLLAMADAGSEAAAYALRGLKPALSALKEDTSSDSKITSLVSAVETAGPDLLQASLALDRVAVARANLGEIEALPWRIRSLLTQADQWLPLARDGLKLAQVLPEIMGSAGPRRYLLIAQNEDELRPTGGFITGAGLLAVENGRIMALSFEDANHIDNWTEKPYDMPPQPLYNLMLSELFLFRDANFWPDFPTSAEKAMELYSYGQDAPAPDGVIAIDQRFVQMLVEVIGPVEIPDTTVTINSRNVIDTMRDAWQIQQGQAVREWIRDRKSFLGAFAGAIRHKFEADFAAIDPIFLGQTMYEAAATKHLQIYLRDPAAAAVLDDLNWDGQLEYSPGQDLLMVVDTNVGFNKVNSLIERNIIYRVTLARDGSGQADLDLHYQHNGVDTGKPCYQSVAYDNDLTYAELADNCYWNYLRVYAPTGSALITATQHFAPGEVFLSGREWDLPPVIVEDPSGLATFANFFLLPWAQGLDTSYTYQLPEVVKRSEEGVNHYYLRVYKQAGTRPQPLQIIISLPEDAHFLSAAPAPTAVGENVVTWATDQNTDLLFTITYR
jgi:hypothetical protein